MLRTLLLNRTRVRNLLPIIGKNYYSSNVTPINMAYDSFGDDTADQNGPPLIIMHGLLGSKQNWRSLSRVLEKRLQRRIFAVDARNHGESPHTTDHGSIHMAADIKALMEAQNISKACLLGHSMGGRTMMYFSLKYPELVDRSVIVDISPVALPTSFTYTHDMVHAMQKVQIPAEVNPAEARKIAEEQLKSAIDDPGNIAFVLLNLKRKPSGEYYWMANLSVLDKTISVMRNFMDQIKVFPAYNGPVLFICGTQSAFVNKSDETQIEELFPNAQMLWLEAGHLVHFDQPQKFIDAVVYFVQK